MQNKTQLFRINYRKNDTFLLDFFGLGVLTRNVRNFSESMDTKSDRIRVTTSHILTDVVVVRGNVFKKEYSTSIPKLTLDLEVMTQ